MDLVSIITSKTFLFTISLLYAIQFGANADALAPVTYVYHDCASLDFDDEITVSVNSLLSELTYHSSNSTFYSSTAGSGENQTYGFFYCTAFVDSQDCHSCVKSAANDSQSYCGSYRSAVVYYRECTLHYSDSPLNGTDVDESFAAWSYSLTPVSYKQFNTTLYSSMETVIAEAANGPNSLGFATSDARLVGTKERLYTFAQCAPYILGSGCENCLRVALDLYQGCCTDSVWGPGRTFLMLFYPSCQLRHEVRNPSSKGIISSSSSSSSPSSRRGLKVWNIVVALVVAAFALR